MRIHFTTAALRRLCNDRTKLMERYGSTAYGVVERRLLFLAAAERLADVPILPPDSRRSEDNSENAFSVAAGKTGRIYFDGFAGSIASPLPQDVTAITITALHGV